MASVLNYMKSIGKNFFNNLFERSIRVYIQKHLGEFLLHKLTPDQVDLGLDGGTLASLYLNAENVNERLESVNVPFTLLEGYIDILHLRIPWKDISMESIIVEVDGLMLFLKIKEEELDDGVDMKSMLESMTASMVEEVMKADQAAAHAEKISEAGKGSSPFESIELMSELISSITSRVQIVLKNVLIKTEKAPGVCIDLHIEELDYFDKDSTTTKVKKPNIAPTPEGFSTKVVEISNVTVNVEEIKSRERESTPQPMDPFEQSTAAFHIAMSSPPNSGSFMQSSMTQSIYPGTDSLPGDPEESAEAGESSGRITILSMDKVQTITIQIKNNEQLQGPTVNVSWNMESFHVFLSPKLISLVTALVSTNTDTEKAQGAPSQMPMTSEDFELCRRAMEEDVKDKENTFDAFNVPHLTMDKHMEMMQGVSADSILQDDDMFYSAYPFKGSSSVSDACETSSVSTFGGNSSFSTISATSAFSHRKSKDRNSGHNFDDHTVEMKNVNIIVPFVSVTVLLKDPEPGSLIQDVSSSSRPSHSVSKQDSVSKKQFSPLKIDSSQNFSHTMGMKHAAISSLAMEFATAPQSRPPCEKDLCTEKHSTIDSGSSPKQNNEDKSWNKEKDKQFPLSDQSDNELQEIANRFFKEIAAFDFRKPLQDLRDEVAKLIPCDHLGLLAKPVQLDILQEKKASDSKLKVKGTFGKLEVIECLFDNFSVNSEFSKTAIPKLPQYSVLLTFDGNVISDTTNNIFDAHSMFDHKGKPQSALTFTLESIKPPRKHLSRTPMYTLSCEFGKLTSEVDITIIDRLTNIFNPDATNSKSSQATQLLDDHLGHLDEAMKDEQSSNPLQLDIKVKISHATLRVRFPIPDLRDNRPPCTGDWCRRNLHKEILVVELEAPEALTQMKPDNPWQLEVQVFKISAYLQEDINKDPILFGEVTVDDARATPHDGHHFNWPRLVIYVSNKANSELETEGGSNTSGTSIEDYVDLFPKESVPFSKKRSMYERDDLSFSGQHAPVNDERVQPGDAAELKNFREECLNRTNLSVDINIPCVVAFMHDRDFLELLYNRFNNDLLMWEPAPVSPHMYLNTTVPSNTSLGVMHLLKQQQEDLASSTVDFDSSDSDEESMHYSIHDHGKHKVLEKQLSYKPTSKMCFQLSIGKGRMLAVVPQVSKDDTDAEDGPKAHGEIMVTLKDGLLFSVNQHGGDPDLKYLCFQAQKIDMFHNSYVTSPVQKGRLDHIRESIPEHLSARIYRTGRWAGEKRTCQAGWGGDSPDMLTLCVKTKVDTINNVKNFILALRIDGGTLKHVMHRSGESWISQAMDLFDLTDFPILGYTVPKVMTEIHVHLENCSVDYRPLYIPVWSFLTIEHFSVCSNIIAESVSSQIRLMLDNSALYLSKKCNKEVNLMKDYVCVADIDQFKIWLQFNYPKSNKHKTPKSDLRFMCNQLNIQTCADSCQALLDLIQYIITDGDQVDYKDDATLTRAEDDGASSHPQTMEEELEERYASSPSLPVPALTPEQEASVMSALQEAMVDCPAPQKPPKTVKQGKGAKVFFHCNPNMQDTVCDELNEAMQITVEIDSNSSSESSLNYEHQPLTRHPDGATQKHSSLDDFEIVDDDFKDMTKIKGSHEVYNMSQSPMEITQSLIPKPTSSHDHLKAPCRFPDPEYQYTLREMSIVWHIYGGSDFSQPRRNSSAERLGLAKGKQSPRSQMRKTLDPKHSPGKKSMQHRGGPWRDFDSLMELDLTKIRFRYELYPTNTKQSSWFKLLMNNVEIRDRMHSSDVNKFLVKLVDKEHPEQSSACMLMFSGVFTRPQHLPFREECEIKAFCLPIKLNVDQGSLNFLRNFISGVSGSDVDSSVAGNPGGRSASPSAAHSSPRSSVSTPEPIMRIREPSSKERSLDEAELLMKFDDYSMQHSMYLQARLNEDDGLEVHQEDLPVFIKSFVLISDVMIKLDYQGKRCDMDQGVMGMMLGVASLTGSVVKLKRINCQKGILGWNKLLMYVANEWLTDIRANQIHSILKGVGSLSVVFQIVQGVTDLVRLPIEQYQKDRRIIRGLQRGANSFTLNTLMALLELTNKVVGSIQYCAELGYDMMSPGPSVRRRKQLRYRMRPPRTTAEGAKAAIHLMTEGVKESASSLSAMVSEESAHKGIVGIVGGTLRNATPECLFKPLALLAEAGSNIVQGARNEVDPNVLKEEEDRWKQT